MAQPQQGPDPDMAVRPKDSPVRGDGRGDRSWGAEEARSFAEAGGEAVRQGLDRGLEAEEALVNANRWMTHRTSEFWRISLDPLLNMQTESLKLFERLWRQAPGFLAFPGAQAMRPMPGFPFASLFGLPAADLNERREDYALRVEVPGLAKEDLNLTIRGDTLVIAAEKRKDQTESESTAWVSERRFGRLDRTFALPRDIDRNGIAARVENGVLEITLPKVSAASDAAVRIPISA